MNIIKNNWTKEEIIAIYNKPMMDLLYEAATIHRTNHNPNVVQVALDAERFGAQGITVHPRPDERHIRYQDVIDLAKVVTTEFNIEGYPDQRFMDLIRSVKPAQATLVPDPPHVLTSNAGWNTKEHLEALQDIIRRIKSWGVRTSIFVDTDLQNIEYAVKTGTDRIELYTEHFAHQYGLGNKAGINLHIPA